jgi:hypothetical protein
MSTEEFDVGFDVLFNNITSNQAPGLNTHEKSVFLTKSQDEVVLNIFSPNSKGNNLQLGFDDSALRQADFSTLMKVANCTPTTVNSKIDRRSSVYQFPSDVYIVINETILTKAGKDIQVVAKRFDEYTRLMSKPFKRPLKYQAWRLLNSGTVSGSQSTKIAEIITNVGDEIDTYQVRYIRKPRPIVLGYLDGLTIEGVGDTSECEVDPILHEAILQRAVELAKIAWTSNGQDNAQLVMTAGTRSE